MPKTRSKRKTQVLGSTHRKVTQAPVAKGMIVTRKNISAHSVRHTEMIGEVTSTSTDWHLSPLTTATPGYDLNPGNGILFPWLSGVARNYERFRFSKVKFYLMSTCPTTTAGAITMAFDYDWDDAIPSSEIQMQTYASTVTATSWQSPVELLLDKKLLNIGISYRYVVNPTRVDPEPRLLYDGFLCIAISGAPVGSKWKLFIEYEVELIGPQLEVSDVPVSYDTMDTSMKDLTLGPSSGTYVYQQFPYSSSTITMLANAALRLVVPGTGDVPVMKFDSAATGAATWGIDLRNAVHGTIQLINQYQSGSYTPTAIINDKNGKGDFAVFNSAGAYLGLASSVLTDLKSIVKVIGPRWSNQLVTAGGPVLASTIIVLQALRKALPAAKYIVPLTTFSSVLGAVGTGVTGLLVDAH